MVARMAMTAITISNSTMVKPREKFLVIQLISQHASILVSTGRESEIELGSEDCLTKHFQVWVCRPCPIQLIRPNHRLHQVRNLKLFSATARGIGRSDCGISARTFGRGL